MNPRAKADRCLAYLAANEIKIQRGSGDCRAICEFLHEKTAHKLFGVFVEIGIFHAGSMVLMSPYVDKEDGLIVGVDPIDKWSGCYDGSKGEKAKRMMQALRDAGRDVRFVNDFSVDAIEKVEQLLAGRKIDLLHIDANHQYQAVKKDFELYLKLMSKHGIIVMHDVGNVRKGTNKFWKELTLEYGQRAMPICYDKKKRFDTGAICL